MEEFEQVRDFLLVILEDLIDVPPHLYESMGVNPTLSQLGADSLDTLELSVDLEVHYNFEIPDEFLNKMLNYTLEEIVIGICYYKNKDKVSE